MNNYENEWREFQGNAWKESIDVAKFIEENYTEYVGNDSFLAGPTDKTKKVWGICEDLLKKELENGILDVETKRVSGINNFEPGYIDKENEVIVGLQTDAPLKRIVNPYGGMHYILTIMN